MGVMGTRPISYILASSAMLFALPVVAQENGQYVSTDVWIEPQDGGQSYKVVMVYEVYLWPQLPSDGWDVVTSAGRKVEYMKLVSNDFTSDQQADLSALYEHEMGSLGITQQARVGGRRQGITVSPMRRKKQAIGYKASMRSKRMTM